MRILSLVPVAVPDITGGRRLYGLDGLSDEDCLNVMRHQCRASPESGEPVLGPHLTRITQIACLVFGDGTPVIETPTAANRGDEPALLTTVLGWMATADRLVVRSRGWLDLFRVRALLHGVSGAPNGWPVVEIVDLSEVLAGVPYLEFMALAGLPDIDEGLDVHAHAEVEAVRQLLLERRSARLDGLLDETAYADASRRLRAFLAGVDRPHLQAFADRWSASVVEGEADG